MDTKGWDVIYSCSAENVNQQLANNMSDLLTTFSFQDGNIQFSGTFDVWQIVSHGSDILLHFETPIKEGVLSIESANGYIDTYDLAGVLPVMELQLSFIDNVTVPSTQNLTFNCQVVGEHVGDGTPGAVTTVTPDASGKISSSNPDTITAWGILNRYLPEVFIANQEALAFIFAQVNLVPPDSCSWLAPKRFEYVYQEPSGGGSGFLSVLSVTTDRDVSQLSRSVDTTLYDTSHESFLLISNELFLKNIVMPTLPEAYGHGATANNFVYKTTGGTNGKIINNGHLSCGKIKSGLIYYYPEITSLTIEVQDDYLVTSAAGDFDITGLAGASVTFSLKSRNQCVFNPSNQTIMFKDDPNPSVNYDKHIPWYDWAVAVIGGPIIIGIVDLVIELVTNAVCDTVTTSISSDGKNTVAEAAPQLVKWNGMESFTTQDAGLSQAFYMRGKNE